MSKIYLAGVLLLATAAAANADWLVTTSGAKVETRGPWKVKGRSVVFNDAKGALSSLRLADVDLAASAIATSEALITATAAAKPAAVVQRPVTHVITDDDVARFEPEGGTVTPTDPAATEAAAAPPAGPQSNKVSVSAWEREERGDDLVITGTITNPGPDTAVAIRMTTNLYDESSQQIASKAAEVATNTLAAGQSTTFSVIVEGVTDFSAAHFDCQATYFRAAPAAPQVEGQSAATPAAGTAEDELEASADEL